MKSGLRLYVSFPARTVAFLLRSYHRYLSPYMPPLCRFYPTCSVYAAETIESFGLVRGGLMSLARLIRCNPFCSGGIDLPPKAEKQTK